MCTLEATKIFWCTFYVNLKMDFKKCVCVCVCVCIYIYMVFFNPVNPESGTILSEQINYSNFKYLNIPGRELNVCVCVCVYVYIYIYIVIHRWFPCVTTL